MKNLKYAVILSGSGFLDGSEIRESVLTLLSLDSNGIEYDIFSLDKVQHHTVDHLSGNENQVNRNMLVESARIARGKVLDLAALEASNYDGLVIPGGFGVAKNLCTFAFDGADAKVEGTTKKVIKEFHSLSKPITAICIAPALIALCLKEVTVTIGTDKQTASVIEKIGAKHQMASSSEYVLDLKNKIVTTPAYMHEKATLDEIYQGINGAIKAQMGL